MCVCVCLLCGMCVYHSFAVVVVVPHVLCVEFIQGMFKGVPGGGDPIKRSPAVHFGMYIFVANGAK